MRFHEWTERIPDPVIRLIMRLDENGFEAWLVGGCVRDMSLGIMPDDYDVATNAKPEQVGSLFQRCLETGIRHGTVTVLLSGLSIEVTTFRSEGPYSDGRRPDHIRFENGILPDLARRDFTINSMAWHPYRGLIDPFGGLADLNELRLRCVGSAFERIQEDALRLLRAVRFSLSYDLKPDKDLINAISENFYRVRKLSSERLSHEVSRLMIASYSHNLFYFSNTQLMGAIADKLLGLSVDSKVFSNNLACFIQPFWIREQIWPVFYLACQMAELNVEPAFSAVSELGYFSLQNWMSVKSKMTALKLAELTGTFVSSAKISKGLARCSRSILIFIGLRLMLLDTYFRNSKSKITNYESEHRFHEKYDSRDNHDYQGSLSRLQIKILIRSCLRSTRLDPESLFKYLSMSIKIVMALQSDQAFVQVLAHDLEEIEMIKNESNLLLTQDLELKGDNKLLDRLQRPEQRKIYLERLVSAGIYSGNVYSARQLESILSGWLNKKNRQGSKK